jgi:hypothetical protein
MPAHSFFSGSRRPLRGLSSPHGFGCAIPRAIYRRVHRSNLPRHAQSAAFGSVARFIDAHTVRICRPMHRAQRSDPSRDSSTRTPDPSRDAQSAAIGSVARCTVRTVRIRRAIHRRAHSDPSRDAQSAAIGSVARFTDAHTRIGRAMQPLARCSIRA